MPFPNVGRCPVVPTGIRMPLVPEISNRNLGVSVPIPIPYVGSDTTNAPNSIDFILFLQLLIVL